MKKLPISIGILSWKDTDNLNTLLQNYKARGLFEITDDIHVLLADGTEDDINVVKKYPELRYTVTPNLGIGGGISRLCQDTVYEYFMFLENDWFIYPENNIYEDVARSKQLLEEGFVKVDFRSIKKPGWANLVGTSPRIMQESGEPKEYWDEIAFMFLHWLGDSPSKKYPGIIYEGEDYVYGSTRHFPWGNNPFIIHKSLIMNKFDDFNQRLSPEWSIQNWFKDQEFRIARLKDGPFYHYDTKRYNPLLRKLQKTATGIQAGFSYMVEDRGFMLKGALYTNEVYKLDRLGDMYFVGGRNVAPIRTKNRSHVYMLNTTHDHVIDLKILVYQDEFDKDLVVKPKEGGEYNLGPIKNLIVSEFELSKPQRDVIIVDDFYLHPYHVREYALRQDYAESNYHKGRRSLKKYYPPYIKEQFEKILGKRITKWNEHGYNGVFQYCTAEDKLVYHVDSQTYAAVLFLTPDAPPESGTAFYQCKDTGRYSYTNEEHGSPEYNRTFKNGYYDKTGLVEIDRVGNKFNRLVIFNAQQIHAATEYFGNNVSNSRLFQIFFFDAE